MKNYRDIHVQEKMKKWEEFLTKKVVNELQRTKNIM